MIRDAQDHQDALADYSRWKSGPRFQSAEGGRGLAAWLLHNAGEQPRAQLEPVPPKDDPLAATIRAAVDLNREGRT
jgi:hypothetical protein